MLEGVGIKILTFSCKRLWNTLAYTEAPSLNVQFTSIGLNGFKCKIQRNADCKVSYFAFLTQFISIILRLSDEWSQTQAWSVTNQSKDKPSQGREGHFRLPNYQINPNIVAWLKVLDLLFLIFGPNCQKHFDEIVSRDGSHETATSVSCTSKQH